MAIRKKTYNSKKIPDKDVLLNQLRIKWDDHFQTRTQTWNMFQYQLAILGVAIGADLQFNTDNKKLLFTISLGILMLSISYLALRVSIYHRKVQHWIFHEINVLESALGYENIPNLCWEPKKPHKQEFWIIKVFKPTILPHFMIQVQFVLLVLVILYIIIRLLFLNNVWIF